MTILYRQNSQKVFSNGHYYEKMKPITFGSFFLTLILVALVFQNILVNYVPMFSYADEILALIGFVFCIFFHKCKSQKAILISLGGTIVVGLLGNILANIVPLTYFFEILVDVLSICKIFFVYLGFYCLLKRNTLSSFVELYTLFIKCYLLVALIFLLFTYAGITNFYDSIRFGFKEYRFLATNAGIFGYIVMSFLPFLLYKKNYVFVLIGAILIMATLKGPQIIFAIMFAILTLFKVFKIRMNILLVIGFGVLLVAFIGKYQIENYLLNEESARSYLIKYSFITANRYIFGAGFATFGSEMSRRLYPALYYQYGFNVIWGLSYNYPFFLLDCYLAMAVGQFGYIGFATLIIAFFFLTKQIIFDYKKTRAYPLVVSILFCFLLSSVGSGYLVSYVGILNAVSIALLSKSFN